MAHLAAVSRGDGKTHKNFFADSDLILDIAEEIAEHPGRPKGISFTWYRDPKPRNPKSILKALRWMKQVVKLLCLTEPIPPSRPVE